MIGLGLGLGMSRSRGFSPLSLFAASEPGAWYDPSDLTTLFQDSAGTTPVTAAGQPVGRIKDKSGNGFHATQTTAEARPTYQADVTLPGLEFGGVVFPAASNILVTDTFLDASFNTSFSYYAVITPGATSGTQVYASHNASRFYAGQDSGANQLLTTGALSDAQMNATRPTNSPTMLVCFRYDGANKRAEIFGPESQRSNEEAATGNLGFAGTLTLGDLSTGGFRYQGAVSSLLMINKVTTEAEHKRTTDYFRERFALNFSSAPRVFCDGNSLTAGNGSSGGAGGETSYPAQMAALLSGWDVVNLGVPSVQTPVRNAAAPEAIDYKLGSHRLRNVAVLWEITNQLKENAPATSTQAIADYVTWCEGRRAAGYKVVAVTVLPREQVGLYADFETHRQEANAYIRANWTDFADALADVAADNRIGDFGDSGDATYYDDGIHLNDLGYSIVAGIVETAVRSV